MTGRNIVLFKLVVADRSVGACSHWNELSLSLSLPGENASVLKDSYIRPRRVIGHSESGMLSNGHREDMVHQAEEEISHEAAGGLRIMSAGSRQQEGPTKIWFQP